ncbi:MFS-type transporter SLC18B1-like [Protopterus annectens]|uniref:MFS-type transporter SLC18B1-like n=1 Tax=Protopterus annectens TaxID=7888 RepID=UPI001CF9FF0C|nr:MFS-type transporter SLC18B1-like [Protopterus annectens]
MMTACSAGGALCFCLLGPIPVFKYKMELWHFITVLVVMGIFSSGAFVPSFAGILLSAKNHGFEDNLRTLGLVSGLFTSLWSLGNVIGPTIAGILSDVAGYKWAFAIEGSLLFLVAIIMILFHLCSHKSRNRSPVPNQLEPLEENSPLQS